MKISFKKINQNLTSRAVVYMFGSFFLRFFAVVAAPVFVRLMSPDAFGLSAVFLSWVLILSRVVSLRVEATVQNARMLFGEKELLAYCSSVLLLSTLSLCLAVGLSFILAPLIVSVSGLSLEWWLLAVITAFFTACSEMRKAYFQVTRNATGDLIVSVVLSASQVCCSIALLLAAVSDGFSARVVGYAIPTAVIGLAICLFFFMKGRGFLRFKYWRFCLSLSIPMIFNGIAYLLIEQGSRLMLGNMIDAEAAGIFSFVFTCALPLGVLCIALGTAWSPEFYDLMKNARYRQIIRHAKRYMINVTLAGVVLMLTSTEVLHILGTRDYYVGSQFLPLLILSYYVQFLYTWPVNYEFYHRKTRSVALVTIATAILSLVLNVLFIPILGTTGAAVSVLLAYICLFLLHHAYAKKTISDYQMPLAWYVPGIAFMAVAMLLTYAFGELVIVRWLIACIAGGLLVMRVVRDGCIV